MNSTKPQGTYVTPFPNGSAMFDFSMHDSSTLLLRRVPRKKRETAKQCEQRHVVEQLLERMALYVAGVDDKPCSKMMPVHRTRITMQDILNSK